MTHPVEEVREFLVELMAALGLAVEVSMESSPEGLKAEISGADSEPLLRRKGEALDAVQHVANAAFGHALDDRQRLVVDCQGFRKASDRELQRMARFLMDKVRSTGVPQEIGPLNSYARRLVHLEVGTASDLASESQGDGAVKTVLISRRG